MTYNKANRQPRPSKFKLYEVTNFVALCGKGGFERLQTAYKIMNASQSSNQDKPDKTNYVQLCVTIKKICPNQLELFMQS